MDGGHKTLSNAERSGQDRSERGETGGGAGGGGHEGQGAGVRGRGDTQNEKGCVVLWGCGAATLLGTASNVSACTLFVEEDTGRLADVVCTSLTPWDIGGVLLVEEVNHVAIDFNTTISLFNSAVKAS